MDIYNYTQNLWSRKGWKPEFQHALVFHMSLWRLISEFRIEALRKAIMGNYLKPLVLFIHVCIKTCIFGEEC